LGVVDQRPVVGRVRADLDLLGERAPAQHLVGGGRALPDRVVLRQPVDIGTVEHTLVERRDAGRRRARDLRDVAAGAVEHLDDLAVGRDRAAEILEVYSRWMGERTRLVLPSLSV